MSVPAEGRGSQGGHGPGGASVRLLGPLRIESGTGERVALSQSRRAVLCALVAAGRPLSRRELAGAAGISRSTLNPLLNRLAGDLGLEGPLHRAVGSRSRLVELDVRAVESDIGQLRQLLVPPGIDRFRAQRLLDLQLRGDAADLGLVPGHPLAAELAEDIEELRREGLRRLAWHDLRTGGWEPSLTGGLDLAARDLPELWLARLDATARRNPAAARDLLGALGGLGPIPYGDRSVPFAAAARVVVETAGRFSQPQGFPSDAVVQLAAHRIASVVAATSSPVAVIGVPGCTESRFEAIASHLARRWPGTLSTWSGERSPAGMAADIVWPILAERIRTPSSSIHTGLLAALVAVLDGEVLEPSSNHRWFSREVGELLASWAPVTGHLLVVGRPAAISPDQDRLLADLARLDPHLRLVVVHDGSPGEVSLVLDELGVTISGVDPAWGVGRRSRVQTTGCGEGATASLGPVDRARLLGLVAYAADTGSRILAPLADHLLSRAGASVGVLELARVVPQSLDPEVLELQQEPTRYQSSLAGSDRLWAVREALAWLLEERLAGAHALAVFSRLVTAIDGGSEAVGVAASVRSMASVAASHGDHEHAVAMLSASLGLRMDADQRVAVLAQRAVSYREVGHWKLAADDYREAIELLNQHRPDLYRITELVLGLARLTWDPELGIEVDRLLGDVLRQLPPDEAVLRARVELCLAGGSFQDGGSGAERIGVPTVRRAVRAVLGSADPAARAWGLVHGRKALLALIPVAESLQLAEDILDHGAVDVALLAHGYQAQFVDRLRQGRWTEAQAALERVEHLARTPVSAEQRFSAVVARTCWSFASGEYGRAALGLAEEQTYSPLLGGSTFDQVTLAHAAWLARTSDAAGEVESIALAAAAMSAAEPRGAIWAAGGALLLLDCGRVAEAADILAEFGRSHGGLRNTPQGPHRLPILAITALVAAAAEETGRLSPFPEETVSDVSAALEAEDAAVVLIGWPTVVLGPVDRFRALAAAALREYDKASEAIERAAVLDGPLPGVHGETAAARELIGRLTRRSR